MGYITFEKSLRDFYKDSRFASYKLSDRLIKDNIISSDEAPILFEVRDLRNKIAHGLNQNKLSKDTVQQYLEFFKKIQDKLVSEHKNSPHL